MSAVTESLALADEAADLRPRPPLPAWSVPLVIGGWVLVIVGSLMARGGADM